MANNCPFWTSGNCTPPDSPVYPCSYSKRDYDSCAVYVIHKTKAAGGSMEDQLHAAGVIPPGARVVSERGRLLSDDELRSLRSKPKWWQFWK